MRLLSLCALPVGAVYWAGSAPLPGGAAPGPKLSLVIKATFSVSFGLAELSPRGKPMAGNEVRWIGDEPVPFACSDFEPFKLRSEILLVGHAHSASPRQLIPLSFGVDAFRKSAVAVAATPTHKIPLLPRHLRTIADPRGPATAIGPSAPSGLRTLTDCSDSAWLMLEGREMLYPSFNCAPEDQQLTDPISESATIMLAGLSSDAPQKVFRLPGVRPQVFYLNPTPRKGEPTDRKVPLVCDTLWMDVDSSLLTLTWRGIVPLLPNEDVPDLIMSLGLVGTSKQHHDIWSQRDQAKEVPLLTARDATPATGKAPPLARSETTQLPAIQATTEKIYASAKPAWEVEPDDAPTPLPNEEPTAHPDEEEEEVDDDQRATQRPPSLAEAGAPVGTVLGKLSASDRLGGEGTVLGLVLGRAPKGAPRAPHDPLGQTMHLSRDPDVALKLGSARQRENEEEDAAEQARRKTLLDEQEIDDESTGVIQLDELKARRSLPFGPLMPTGPDAEQTGVVNLDELKRKAVTPFARDQPEPPPYDDLVEPTASLPGGETPGLAPEESTGLIDIEALRAGATLPFEHGEDPPTVDRVDSRDDALSRTLGVAGARNSGLPFRHNTAMPPPPSPGAFPREDGFLPFRPASPPEQLPTAAAHGMPGHAVGEEDWASRNLIAPHRFATVQCMVWRDATTPEDFDAVHLPEMEWLVAQARWAQAIDDDANNGETGLVIQLLDRLAEEVRVPSLSSSDATTAS